MKKLIKFWNSLKFSNQLTIVFVGVFLIQLIIVQWLSGYYMGEVLEEKIKESFRHTLQQTASNLDTSMLSYKDAISQLFGDTDFIMEISALGREEDEEEQKKIKEELDSIMKEFMTYRSEIRCMSVKTENGLVYGYDRMENELLNPIISELHKTYYGEELFENNQGLKGVWTPTEFLDRRGTIEYYVYSYGKQITDWYVNRQVGTGIVSIEEKVLEKICKSAQISEDSRTNFLFITDKKNNIVSYTDKELIGKNMNRIIEKQDNGLACIQGEDYFVFQEEIPSTKWQLVSALNVDYVYDKLGDIQKIIWIVSLMLAILVIVLVACVSKKMSRYINDILNTMNKVQGGKLSSKVPIPKGEKNEISQIATHFNIMMNTVNEQMEMIKESGKREKEAEIRALEAQINPHFVYNTLDSINWLAIENGQEEISSMLSQFAQILRYQIQKSNKIVTIQEELGYLEKYLFLQKARFMDSFEYVIECQETVKMCRINKMIFQPFIENAILHGVADMETGGLITIKILNVNDNLLSFIVSDNGHGMTEEQIRLIFEDRTNPGNSIGVLNVLDRLDLYYGKDYTITIQSHMGQGTVITTTIPKSYETWEERHENTDC